MFNSKLKHELLTLQHYYKVLCEESNQLQARIKRIEGTNGIFVDVPQLKKWVDAVTEVVLNTSAGKREFEQRRIHMDLVMSDIDKLMGEEEETCET